MKSTCEFPNPSSDAVQPTESPRTTLSRPTLWMWVSRPFHAFRLRTLRGILENEQFLEENDPQFKALSGDEQRAEAYRFMNLQRNILWIVRFFLLAGAGITYYLLLK